MEFLGILMGSSWAAGVNLYLTTAALGIAHCMEWIELPGKMESLSHPLVIAAALLIFAVEVFADKIPFVDSAWDSVHTFIRPAGGMVLGYLAMIDAGPALQYPIALLTGVIAMDSHLVKATSRAAINTSPEPVSNIVASTIEDISVLGAIYLIINHLVVATILVILFIIFSVWFLKKMFRFLKKIFKGKDAEQVASG